MKRSRAALLLAALAAFVRPASAAEAFAAGEALVRPVVRSAPAALSASAFSLSPAALPAAALGPSLGALPTAAVPVAAPALPSAQYYDPAHWSPAIIPGRDYAGRLADAAALLSSADRTRSPGESASRNAQADLIETMKAKDPSIHSHMLRVGLLAGLIASRMGLSADFALETMRAGRLHDIGKREDAILPLVNKRGALTPEERIVVERHTVAGADIIAAAPGIDAQSRAFLMNVALTHHETADGKGYPRALPGEAIPLASRIVNLADFYDALMENRPYRAGMTTQRALSILDSHREKFDAAVWKAFRALFDELGTAAAAQEPTGLQ
ncbi:MAG: HD-GYP domain-containing protein [Elusimicrobiota bacterium]